MSSDNAMTNVMRRKNILVTLKMNIFSKTFSHKYIKIHVILTELHHHIFVATSLSA